MIKLPYTRESCTIPTNFAKLGQFDHCTGWRSLQNEQAVFDATRPADLNPRSGVSHDVSANSQRWSLFHALHGVSDREAFRPVDHPPLTLRDLLHLAGPCDPRDGIVLDQPRNPDAGVDQ
jgi:hypothetical protein